MTSDARRAVLVVFIAAAGAYALTMGARLSMGLFMGPLNTATGLGIANISLALAFGQLWWGVAQPFAGIAAERYGTGRILVAGVLLMAVGTALIPFMTTTMGLIFAIGVLSAGGSGMAGPSVLMSAAARLVPAEKRGIATGIVNAGGSFGQFAFAPIAQAITAAAGWVASLQSMAAITLLALPAAWVLRGKPIAHIGSAPIEPVRGAVMRALASRDFRLILIGFFFCGVHVAFLATHLPGVVASCNLSPALGAWALAVVGLFNIVGSFVVGWAVGYCRMKMLLSLIYTARALAILVFIFAPKTEFVVLAFSAVMGLGYLSTVPPTVGLIAKHFGTARMATLFGIVMLSHQIGGFLGAWLGGKSFTWTGSYDWMWWLDIVLAFGAALLHLPIREQPVAHTVPAPV